MKFMSSRLLLHGIHKEVRFLVLGWIVLKKIPVIDLE
jgi:hypothetical protein